MIALQVLHHHSAQMKKEVTMLFQMTLKVLRRGKTLLNKGLQIIKRVFLVRREVKCSKMRLFNNSRQMLNSIKQLKS